MQKYSDDQPFRTNSMEYDKVLFFLTLSVRLTTARLSHVRYISHVFGLHVILFLIYRYTCAMAASRFDT